MIVIEKNGVRKLMALKLLNFDPHSPPNTRKLGDLVIIFNFPVAAKDEFDKWGN